MDRRRGEFGSRLDKQRAPVALRALMLHISGDEHVAFHHSDFCFDEHRCAVEASRRAGSGAAAQAAPFVEHELSASWDAFHRQHCGAAFFRPRRYLLAEFPLLAARGKELTVLELGCGNGSSCLPLLLANPDARVVACDFAESAVAATRQAVSQAGVSSRFVAFHADPGAGSAQEFAAALSAAVSLAGWPPLTRFDAVLAVFVLSALPPARVPNFLASACSCLRPGGCLLARDYGIFDQAHLRFSDAEAACDASGRLFRRQDGTLARFFDRDELVDTVCGAAASAGVHLAGEAEWHTVAVPNRAKNICMRRIFVHAVFTRALDDA